MLYFIKNSFDSVSNPFGLYLFSSALVGCLFWLSEIVLLGGLYPGLGERFFLTIFVLISLYTWIKGYSFQAVLSKSVLSELVFLSQYLSLVGASIEMGDQKVLFLSSIPLATNLSFIRGRRDIPKEVKWKKEWALSLIGLATYTWVLLSCFSEEGRGHSLIVFGLFLAWQMGIFYWLNVRTLRNVKDYWRRERLRSEEKSLNDLGQSRLEEQDELRGRLFFHDLINLTHGVNLFLEHRICHRQSLNLVETQTLRDEVKTLQSLIKDHYGYKHKDLRNCFELVRFELIERAVYQLVNQFLQKVDVHFVFKGAVSREASRVEREACLVHYPSLYRIMNNLIKNISESHTDQVEICFDYRPEGLFVFLKNRIFKLRNDSQYLTKKLEKMILEGSFSQWKNDPEGLGLESVNGLCREQGGHFEFYIIDGFWVSEVFLPMPKKENLWPKAV